MVAGGVGQQQQQQQQPTLLTLHDAITDSPVYRANVLHFDEQIDLLEKWLDQMSKHLKQYTEKLNKFNLETNNVCKKVIPVGIDDALIDPNFTGAVIRNFSDALQTSLAFKTKLVSDLEDNVIQPLAQFVKTHLKGFKEFRKQHEKALERYETQLQKYASQSKTKEASAVREEAFRLHEARKAYVRMSGQHVVRILQFRSMLEHFLVEAFSAATQAHLYDFDGGKQVWQKLDASLASWKQWLIDDRTTCDYQLRKLQAARKQLESEYIRQLKPQRDLEKYAPATAALSATSNGNNTIRNSRHSLEYTTPTDTESRSSVKWGYLFARVSRTSWARKWFFLYDGYFGTCQVNTSGKLKGAITVGDRVSVLLCDVKPTMDADRRFCFEVVCAQQAPFYLQAETEEEMRDWMGAFAKAKRFLLENEQLSLHTRGDQQHDHATSGSESDSPRPSRLLTPANGGTTVQTTDVSQSDSPSFVLLSTSFETERISLASSTTLTPLLVYEAARSQQSAYNISASSSPPASPAAATQSFASAMASSLTIVTSTSNNAGQNGQQQQQQTPSGSMAATTTQSSWGIPWNLVPNMFSGSSNSDDSDHPPSSPVVSTSGTLSGAMDADGHIVIWPTRFDDSNTPKVELTGYTAALEARNRELRHLFGGVSPSEIVMDAFIGSLKRKPSPTATSDSDQAQSPETPTSGTFESLDQELNAQLSGPVKGPTSEYGYSYTGRAFITQETFWFYSCVLLTCVTTVAVRLKDIKNVRLIRDTSITDSVNKNGKANNIALAIDIDENNGEAQGPLVLTTLLDDVEVVAERLRIAIQSAKSQEPWPLQVMYDVIRNMSAAMSKNSTVTTIIKKSEQQRHHPIRMRSTPDLHAAAAATSATMSPSSSATTTTTTTATGEFYQPEPALSPIPDSKDKKKQRKPRKSSGSNKPVPKSGALAAAMMAATVAGGSGFFDASKLVRMEEAMQKNSSKQRPPQVVPESSSSISLDQEKPPVPVQQSAIDASSSSVSGAEEELIPSHIKVPSGPYSCGCEEHLDKIESEIELPISAKRLYDLLFSSGSSQAIWEAKNNASGGSNLRMGPWETVDGKQQRVLKYILPVNNPMVKVKEAEVVETQVLLKKEDYLCYVVQISTKTAQLPYADAFMPSVRYCITWVSKTQCKLVCSMGVKFIKSVLVKDRELGMISKAASKGMAESIASFTPILQEEANKLAGTNKSGSSSAGEGIVTRATTLKRQARVTSRPSLLAKRESTKKEEQYWAILWSTVRDLPFYLRAIIAGVLVLWVLWAWLRSPTKPEQQYDREVVVSRAVYLRDLEDGLLKTQYQPSYANAESYQLFLAINTNQTAIVDQHRWFNATHHRMAVELLFSRERVALLRHDMLVIFQLLNEIDAQLLENEYINWMLDTRLRCRRRQPSLLLSSSQCDQVQTQLDTFFK